MNQIKTVEEIARAVAREQELLPEVLVVAFRIVESYPAGSIVTFGASDIVEVAAYDHEQSDRALHVLEQKGLLKRRGISSGDWVFTITDYGREKAREVITHQTHAMQKMQQNVERQNVFIIHGHDESFKKEVFEFVKEIGLNPIVLHEVEDYGRTIIEKLENEVRTAQFAISLWSPDDEMADGKFRARQNVIYETGIFCTALTRKGVRILVKGDVEIPSDLDGVLRTHLDSSDKWKKELIREFSAAGILLTK